MFRSASRHLSARATVTSRLALITEGFPKPCRSLSYEVNAQIGGAAARRVWEQAAAACSQTSALTRTRMGAAIATCSGTACRSGPPPPPPTPPHQPSLASQAPGSCPMLSESLSRWPPAVGPGLTTGTCTGPGRARTTTAAHSDRQIQDACARPASAAFKVSVVTVAKDRALHRILHVCLWLESRAEIANG